MSLTTLNRNRKKALFLARKQLPELVCDAVNLEGINFTLPEVQTLLGGITVGGHSLQNETITLNQANAWRFLFDSVDRNRFSLSESFVCELHEVLAQKEALTWGVFRSGGITIAGADYVPPDADKLPDYWQKLQEEYHSSLPQQQMRQRQATHQTDIVQTYHHAIGLFLQMARIQFFYDANKRLGRLMMNGFLLMNGLPVINLPATRQLEFNQLMLAFYPSDNMQPMQDFMLSCLSQKAIQIMSE